MTRGKYANIIIDISHEKVDRSFQYRIPRELEEVLEEGMCVEVPFGKGDHLRQGYVVEITDRAERYRPQLEAYSLALTRVLEAPVTRRVLYFLTPGEAVEI